MASLKQQKKAQLSKKRDQFMALIFNAKMKHANEVRVIREFASVVTFLDGEDAPTLSHNPIVNNKEIAQAEVVPAKVQPKEMPPHVNSAVEKRSKSGIQRQTEGETSDKTEEVNGSSDYWDEKYS